MNLTKNIANTLAKYRTIHSSLLGSCFKIVEILSFSPTPWAGEKILSTNSDHHPLFGQCEKTRNGLLLFKSNSHKCGKAVQNQNIKTSTHENKIFKIGLVGNPNSGKTTLFNRLTGSNQYVGNWPGVTVEKKEGFLKNHGLAASIIDLPGIYSLSPYSPEEVLTREFIANDPPDLIINIIDSANIERNLYLTTQLMELDCNVILAVNMTDILEKKGKVIDYNRLEKRLGIPVVPISASKNNGLDKLIYRSSDILTNKTIDLRQKNKIFCPNIEFIINKISDIIEAESNIINKRFYAVKIFEDDFIATCKFNFSAQTKEKLQKLKKQIPTDNVFDREIIIADQRYKYICKICKESIKEQPGQKKKSMSNKIDLIATGKFTSLPLFIILMFIIFYITFGPVGNYLKCIAENIINLYIGAKIENILIFSGASDWSKSLIMDAVIRGVGSVISFLPQVLILYGLLSFLEDSGYMARAAFVMDKLLKKLGLSGKSFIPLLMGFGCSVPAVLGSRIIENKKDRFMTIFLIPFMSCSAKTPIYLLFASSFFPYHQTIVIFGIYALGVLMAVFTAYIFKGSLFKGENSTFIMEMPEYKFPSAKNLWLHIWQKTKNFIANAGTVILGATIVIWFLESFDKNFSFVSDSSKSILAFVGNLVSPIFTVCGFGDWRAVMALFTGFIAKESIVSSMTLLYKSDNAKHLSDILTNSFSAYAALAYMVFVLLCTPCIAALSAIYKEFGSIKLTVFSIIYQLFVAFLFSAITFQLGTLIGSVIFK
ncbi:MAG: ferrous iron transport protein B [Oscillospiraceae bacterium]|jgi:ferrous iron transport protein B|nr:ferrous iron transport protein B [Oscillospiraceae bacterium]